jgi:hypothetical protein
LFLFTLTSCHRHWDCRNRCFYWKKKTAATPNSVKIGVLALAMAAAAPVLEELAAAELDEPRADVPALEVTTEVTVLLDPLEEEEVNVGETIVVLRTAAEPVPALGATMAMAVVLVRGVGGEVWIDTIAVKLVSDEL